MQYRGLFFSKKGTKSPRYKNQSFGITFMPEKFWYFCIPFIPLFLSINIDNCRIFHVFQFLYLKKRGVKGIQKYQNFSGMKVISKACFSCTVLFVPFLGKKWPRYLAKIMKISAFFSFYASKKRV